MLAVDKTNAEARKELLKVREKIQAAKAEDKKVRLACMHVQMNASAAVWGLLL